MEKIVLKWLMANGYVGFGAVLFIVSLTVMFMLRVNKLIDTFESTKEKIDKNEEVIRKLDKRTKKMTHIMGQCPSVTRDNALWVQDDTRNGGQPPSKSACKTPCNGDNCVKNG